MWKLAPGGNSKWKEIDSDSQAPPWGRREGESLSSGGCGAASLLLWDVFLIFCRLSLSLLRLVPFMPVSH